MSRRLRVLLVSTPVGPLGSGIGGGVELTLHNLVFGLTELGHRVDVVAPSPSLHVGERVHQVDGAWQQSAQSDERATATTMPTGSVLAAMWQRVRELASDRTVDFDVIVNLAYDWLPFYLTAFIDTPVVHLVSMGSLTDAMDEAIADVATRFPGRLAAHSRAQVSTFADGDAFRVVGNGIVTERYDFRPLADPDGPLGFVGRISPEKGLEDVAALSQRAGREVRVWGMLQDADYWHRVLADHPGARLDYRGFLPTDEMQADVGACAAVVMTSKWVEAFGNVAIEAMATGVPVITYDRGGPAEIVVDGVTGFVVPADDVSALAAAVSRLDEIDRRACRARVDEVYSSVAMARRVVAWFDDVLEGLHGGAVASATTAIEVC